MIRVLAFMETLNSALEAGVDAVIASYGVQSVYKAVGALIGILGVGITIGAGTMTWVSFQRDLPGRVQAIEIELSEKRTQDEELYKMVCEIRATLRGLDPLSCWRGEIEINLPGGR